jgi:hypothetical protein
VSKNEYPLMIIRIYKHLKKELKKDDDQVLVCNVIFFFVGVCSSQAASSPGTS